VLFITSINGDIRHLTRKHLTGPAILWMKDRHIPRRA
jgi:hypothetical protein